MHRNRGLNWLRLLLATALAVALILWCLRHVDFRHFLESLQHTNLMWLGVALLATSSVLIFKTYQWDLLLGLDPPLGFKKLFPIVCIWLGAANVFPFYGGEAFAVYLLYKKKGIPKTKAISVLTLEQMADGVSILGMILLLSFVIPFPDWMVGGVRGFILLVALAYLTLLFLAHRYPKEPEGCYGDHGGWKAKIKFLFATWAHHLKILRSLPQSFSTALLSLLCRVVEVLSLYFIQKSLGLSLAWWIPIMVVTGLNLALIIPLTPGNLGIFEATVFFIYRYFGVDPAIALSLGVVYHAISLLPYLVSGYGFAVTWGIRPSQFRGMPAETPPV